jgi:hypothetical protein
MSAEYFWAKQALTTQASTAKSGNSRPLVTVETKKQAVTSENENGLKVNAFPNPFTNEVTFRFTSPKLGKALLEVYDLVGKKIGVIYQGHVDANAAKAITYKVPLANKSAMVYKLTVGELNAHGKLMSAKQ